MFFIMVCFGWVMFFFSWKISIKIFLMRVMLENNGLIEGS